MQVIGDFYVISFVRISGWGGLVMLIERIVK